MTTALTEREQMTVTERDIREAIEARLDCQVAGVDQMEDIRGVIRHAIAQDATVPLIDSAVDTLEIGDRGVWEPLREKHDRALWTDLRPSQATRLVELVEAACDRAEARCVAAIVEELTAAGVQFVTEHPDAPRATP